MVFVSLWLPLYGQKTVQVNGELKQFDYQFLNDFERTFSLRQATGHQLKNLETT